MRPPVRGRRCNGSVRRSLKAGARNRPARFQAAAGAGIGCPLHAIEGPASLTQLLAGALELFLRTNPEFTLSALQSALADGFDDAGTLGFKIRPPLCRYLCLEFLLDCPHARGCFRIDALKCVSGRACA